MSMKNATREVINKIGELKKLVVGKACDEDMIMSMDSESLKFVQLCLETIDDVNKLMEEYANTMDEQSKKLDMILEKLDKKG